MAEPEPVEAEASQPAQSAPAGGGPFARLKAVLHRVTPGEWALIGLGVAGLVVYFVWYQRNQAATSASSASPAGSTTTPNPDWANAQAQPYDQYEQELLDLIESLQQGGSATVPPTSPVKVLPTRTAPPPADPIKTGQGAPQAPVNPGGPDKGTGAPQAPVHKNPTISPTRGKLPPAP
jgi:hypothetical protein